MPKNFQQKGYRVSWEIDIWALNPREAAEGARLMQSDISTTATVYEVREHDSWEAVTVDLSEEVDNAHI